MGLTPEIVCAGLLHDTAEDVTIEFELKGQKYCLTNTSNENIPEDGKVYVDWFSYIADQFGKPVANYVESLTKPSPQEIAQINDSELTKPVVNWASREVSKFVGYDIFSYQKEKIRETFASLGKIFDLILKGRRYLPSLFVKVADIADNTTDFLSRHRKGQKLPVDKLLRAILGMNLAMILGDYQTSLEINQSIYPFLLPGWSKAALAKKSDVDDSMEAQNSRRSKVLNLNIKVKEGKLTELNLIELNHLPWNFILPETRKSWYYGKKPWWAGFFSSPDEPHEISADEVHLRPVGRRTTWQQFLTYLGRPSATFANAKGPTAYYLIWLSKKFPTIADSFNFRNTPPPQKAPEDIFFNTPPGLTENEIAFHLQRLMLFLIHPNLPFQMGKDRPSLVVIKEDKWFWFAKVTNEKERKRVTQVTGRPFPQKRRNLNSWGHLTITIG